jgi:sugar phosphate isomerase/epimerase
MITRRELLRKSASIALAAPAARVAAALPQGKNFKVCIRLTDVTPYDFAKTLDDMYAIGYRELEGVYDDVIHNLSAVRSSPLKRVAIALTRFLGLRGASALEDHQRDEYLGRCLEQVKEWGFSFATLTSGRLRADTTPGLDKYRAYADLINRAGEKAKVVGLERFLYHLQPTDFATIDGTTPFELIMDRMDKSLCALNMDVYWVRLAGFDPVELLHKYAGRVPHVHMKDQPAGLPVVYDEPPGRNIDNFLDLGQGRIDWAAVIKAGMATGVEHFCVEPNGSNGVENVAGARRSFQYLSSLNL